jgi:hypothetical protein
MNQVQEGLGPNSVSAKGFGNTLPVAPDDNSGGWQQDRWPNGMLRVRWLDVVGNSKG